MQMENLECVSTVIDGLPYKTVRPLGNGRYGEVFLISHIRNSNITAVVKTFEVEKVSEERVLEEFHLHRWLSRNGHENVLSMLWMHRTEEFYYLVMEDVEGEDFGNRLRRGRLEPARVQHYFKQLIAGLKFIHSKGIIHGDIKPNNMLVTKKDQIKICDFGAAVQYRYGSEELCVSTKTKTTSFAAPEIFTNECYRGPPLDIWSSGVTLMIMLTGYRLWERADLRCSSYRFWFDGRENRMEAWRTMNRSALDLLRRMIAYVPERRLTIEQIEQSAWMHLDYGPLKKHKKKSL